MVGIAEVNVMTTVVSPGLPITSLFASLQSRKVQQSLWWADRTAYAQRP